MSVDQKNKVHFNSNLKSQIENTLSEPNQILAYQDYMSHIIQQLPNSDQLQLLTGTSSNQASFFFQENDTGAVNASLYNKCLNQRIEGKGVMFDVKQVGYAHDSFTNSYLSVYTKLRYQLSKRDRHIQEKLNKEVSSTVAQLIPVWNNWLLSNELDHPLKLSSDTNVALVQMTDTLNYDWLNPEFREVITEDPEYPYVHVDQFRIIYDRIPASAPVDMVALMAEVFRISGQDGAITAQVANAAHTLAGVISNVQRPSSGVSGNGGIPVTGSDDLIPGLRFVPANPDELIDQLGEKPALTYSYDNQVERVAHIDVKVNMHHRDNLQLPILEFFTNIHDGYKSSILLDESAGANYRVKVTVRNPTIFPELTNTPDPFDAVTNKGWFLTDPVKEANQNGYPPPKNVTGYVYNSAPNFNFAEDGDFGYINSVVFSQFIELYLHFYECDVNEVKHYFHKHEDDLFQFLWIPLGSESVSKSIEMEFVDHSESELTIILRPKPPGYIPPSAGDITDSLCYLVAVEVIYPFA